MAVPDNVKQQRITEAYRQRLFCPDEGVDQKALTDSDKKHRPLKLGITVDAAHKG